ncbi:LCP family protein [Rossellomorea aquimaris]|uniref:LCP family protein n=1 Tax=Rossellomorea aquimaris TaxID=189382 RepID=UPI001CFDB9E5|nr:LCP family protein [Rossellomorea aquimaris]
MKKIVLILAIMLSSLVVISCSPFWKDGGLPVRDEGPSPENLLTEKGETFPIEMKDPINFLLIGSDQRQNEASRADVMMVAQYTPQSSTMKLVSIMRDTFVEIPGYEKSKINHAYSWGGKELLAETIQQNFDLKIHHTVKIDFQHFTNMMDLVFPNGIEVTITQPMINHWKWAKEPGKAVLKGEEILQYVRFRGDGDNDFGRVERQQEIIRLVEKNLMEDIQSGEGVTTVISLIREGLDNVETSTSTSEVIKFGMSVLLNPIDNVETLRIPVEGSFTDLSTSHAGLVLDMNEQKNREAIREFLSSNHQE